MKETILKQCLDVLKREDIKQELQLFCKPIIQIIFSIINPYIYIIITLVFIIFLMILAILILLLLILRNKKLITNIF